MFTNDEGKGFSMTFANNWAISVQFGYGNYCANRRKGSFGTPAEPCPNAEIMVYKKSADLDEDSESVYIEGDSVRGFTTPDQVAKIVGLMVTWSTDMTAEDATTVLEACLGITNGED